MVASDHTPSASLDELDSFLASLLHQVPSVCFSFPSTATTDAASQANVASLSRSSTPTSCHHISDGDLTDDSSSSASTPSLPLTPPLYDLDLDSIFSPLIQSDEDSFTELPLVNVCPPLDEGIDLCQYTSAKFPDFIPPIPLLQHPVTVGCSSPHASCNPLIWVCDSPTESLLSLHSFTHPDSIPCM